MSKPLSSVLGVAASLGLVGLASAQLAKPVRLEAAGQPISVEVGHAAPYLYDFDRDGVRDLLVGQFGEGRLRIYRNRGTAAKPVYEAARLFEAGGETASVPAG